MKDLGTNVWFDPARACHALLGVLLSVHQRHAGREQFRCPRNGAIVHCGFEKHTPVAATSGKAVSSVFFTEKLRLTDNG
jgi:hypothetical protein